MRQATVHSGSAHSGVRPARPRWPSPHGAFQPEARCRGNGWLVGRFRPADGELSGKIGPMTLSESRGILLGRWTGRRLTGAWLATVMAVKRRGASVKGRRTEWSRSWSGCQSTPGRGSMEKELRALVVRSTRTAAWRQSSRMQRRMEVASADRASTAESGRAEQCGACAETKAKWGRPSSAQSHAEIRTQPHEVVATGGVRSPPHHHTWLFSDFSRFSNFQTLKSKLVIFPMSKLHQFLQVDILEHKEKLSFLAQLKIPQDLKL
jgi:hypothetical protein